MSRHPSAKPVLPAQPAPPPHGTHICANSLQPSPPVLKADTEASPSSPGGLLWLQGTVQYKPGESCPLRWSAAGLPGPRRGRELPNCRDATRKPQQAASILQLGRRYGENGPHAHEIVSDDKCRRENCTHWVIFKFFLHKLQM